MPRILIVEDEPDIALGLEDDLTVEGHDVEVARDGVTALRRGREPGWDLILLDVMLPRQGRFRRVPRAAARRRADADHPADGARHRRRRKCSASSWARTIT